MQGVVPCGLVVVIGEGQVPRRVSPLVVVVVVVVVTFHMLVIVMVKVMVK